MSVEQWALLLYLLSLLLLLGVGYLRRRTKAATNRPRPEETGLDAEPYFPSANQSPPAPPPSLPVVLGPGRSIRLDPALRPPIREGRSRIRQGPPFTLPTTNPSLWQEKGWRRTGNGVEGNFRSAGRAWRGLVKEPYPGRFQAFIWGPPMPEIGRNTAHGACFMNRQADGRYQVHYNTNPRSLDHAICTIEDVLGEALGVAPRRLSPG